MSFVSVAQLQYVTVQVQDVTVTRAVKTKENPYNGIFIYTLRKILQTVHGIKQLLK